MFLFIMLIVCRLDVGKSRVSSIGLEFLVAGVIFSVVGWGFLVWAMVENKFFETAVRIQKEKEHRVISTGPYAIVRHPGCRYDSVLWLRSVHHWLPLRTDPCTVTCCSFYFPHMFRRQNALRGSSRI